MRAANGRPNIVPDPERGGFRANVELPPDALTGKRRRRHVRGKTRGDVADKIQEITGNAKTAAVRGDMTLQQWAEHWLDVVGTNR